MTEFKIKKSAERNRTEDLLVYLMENDLTEDFSGITDIISTFPTDVPNVIKKLKESANDFGIDNDEYIEMLEEHYDINYCGTCNNVLDEYDGDCYNEKCADSVHNREDDDD